LVHLRRLISTEPVANYELPGTQHAARRVWIIAVNTNQTKPELRNAGRITITLASLEIT